jgi:hypothetical protein
VLNIKVTSNNLIYILVFFHIFWRLIIIFPDLISFLYYWKKIKQINLKSNYFPTGSDPLLTHLPDPTHGIPTRVSAARSLPLSPTHCRVGPVCLRPPSPMHLTLLCFAAQHTQLEITASPIPTAPCPRASWRYKPPTTRRSRLPLPPPLLLVGHRNSHPAPTRSDSSKRMNAARPARLFRPPAHIYPLGGRTHLQLHVRTGRLPWQCPCPTAPHAHRLFQPDQLHPDHTTYLRAT